ncbi:tyrosine-type recombinase/integrase [Bradyrhizobium sp. LTSP857]|uniref:tyrosine-type recombinase/integrase n=1 Tax=Bradyrhizobium sp. LTSP857 TaxID=1619231 RepID=UPI0005D26FA8|nr:tyrosine-type recombinase/integrase [Bradyrhizobium sp. LTSP857]KJC42254.1 integrase [Bradyrhizobium sp. LTSP857]
MVRIELKGIAKVKAKGRTYWYAWRGGPRLRGEPGSPEFIASYNEAIEQRRTPDKSRFRFVIVDYKASGDYKKLAESARAQWSKWLDRISDHFGELRTAHFDRPEKIRLDILRWRNQWASTPRTADYALQVLSRVLAHGVGVGKIARNPCEGIKYLYKNNRSEIIWTETDITHIRKTCSAEIAHAIDLAGYTGLRLGDLVRVSWSHVGEHAIVLATGKSRRRREAIVPLYDALKDILARIPKRATTILTSSRRRPWTVDGFGSSFNKAKIDAGMQDRDLNFNDLRGTAATKFYIAGFDEREIAETIAWEEESVKKIIRRYVDRTAAIKARIRKLEAKD